MSFYQIDTKAIEKKFETNTKTGLSLYEAKKRLEAHGSNKLKEEKLKSPFLIILQQFLSPLMYVLLIAAIASTVIGEISDAIVIGLAMLMNVVIGFIQEWKAEKAAASLKAYEVQRCNVRRNDKIISINAQELVPGDIVLLAAGARIPADIRLTYVVDFAVEEAILTGEAHAIKKTSDALTKELSLGDRTNMAYSGTYAISGKAEGVVVATGQKTELGKIAQLIVDVEEEATPLQKQIKRFGWLLGWLMVSITGLVIAVGLIKQIPLKEIVLVAIALAVAAIPEGLLVAVTVVLAIGMQRMLKRKALVRHLIAAETLGSVSVICTDKTGTLTKGHMAVEKIITKENDRDKQDLLVMGALNNDAQLVPEKKERIGNPTEVALLEALYKENVDYKTIQEQFPRTSEIPFSSEKKYMATTHDLGPTTRLIVKGAPEKIFPMCNPDDKAYFEEQAKKLVSDGLRVLALAYKDEEQIDLQSNLTGLTVAGLFGLQDPLRDHAAQTVLELTQAGIRTVVVTGDHKQTAQNIAKGAGISVSNGCVTGTELDAMSDQELFDRVPTVDLFARVDPKHKIRIVQAWQKHNESVAMIGDGVNDAPALKSADIGVALGSGSDAAHEISDMILLNDNLSTISAAVKQGRIIFDNIRKIIVYLLADSFGEIILILASLLAGLPLPLLAIQILWINLVTDGFPNLALTMEPGEPEVMEEKPRAKNEPVLNSEMKTLIFIVGIITDIGLFGLYLVLLRTAYSITYIRTIIFTALAINSLFYVFSVRSFRKSIFRVNPFKNPWLNLAVLGGVMTQLGAVYIPSMQKLFRTVPLGLHEWVIVTGLALIKLIGIELTKEYFIIRRRKRG